MNKVVGRAIADHEDDLLEADTGDLLIHLPLVRIRNFSGIDHGGEFGVPHLYTEAD